MYHDVSANVSDIVSKEQIQKTQIGADKGLWRGGHSMIHVLKDIDLYQHVSVLDPATRAPRLRIQVASS